MSTSAKAARPDDTTTIRVRRIDEEAAHQSTEVEVSTIDLFTAMRVAWEQLPEKSRLQALRQAKQVKAELSASAA